jgi:hypothetical protein
LITNYGSICINWIGCDVDRNGRISDYNQQYKFIKGKYKMPNDYIDLIPSYIVRYVNDNKKSCYCIELQGDRDSCIYKLDYCPDFTGARYSLLFKSFDDDLSKKCKERSEERSYTIDNKPRRRIGDHLIPIVQEPRINIHDIFNFITELNEKYWNRSCIGTKAIEINNINERYE